jgi:hypothetical protein
VVASCRLELQHAQRSNDLAQTKRSEQRVRQAQMAVDAAASMLASAKPVQVTRLPLPQGRYVTNRGQVTPDTPMTFNCRGQARLLREKGLSPPPWKMTHVVLDTPGSGSHQLCSRWPAAAQARL